MEVQLRPHDEQIVRADELALTQIRTIWKQRVEGAQGVVLQVAVMQVVIAARNASVQFDTGFRAGLRELVTDMVARAPGPDPAGSEPAELNGVFEIVKPRGGG